MALSDALALCPRLRTQKATPETKAVRLLELARWCERYSPLSNIYDADSLWIDVTGVMHLFKGEVGLLMKIKRDFSRLGYTVELALASSFAAAFALSHFAFDAKGLDNRLETHILPVNLSGQLAKPLSLLPVKALRLSPKITFLLHRLGLNTIGQLVDLPRKTLKRRFPSREQAEAVLHRLDQILDLRDEPLAPLTPVSIFASRVHFAEPLFSKQMLERALKHLIFDIARQLEKQKQGARQLTFTLWRPDESTINIKIGTRHPCRSRSHIFKLFHEKLDSMEPGFGIDNIALCVDLTEPLSAMQTSLTNDDPAQNPVPLSILLDRLSNRLNPSRIGYLHPLESHIPERAQRLKKTPPLPGSWFENSSKKGVNSSPPSYDRPFLLLDPPEKINVIAPLPDEPPLLFTWRRVTRKVKSSKGPERITPEWWRELDNKISRPRDYYKISTLNEGSFWLYRDGLYEGEQNTTSLPKWFMHGFFG